MRRAARYACVVSVRRRTLDAIGQSLCALAVLGAAGCGYVSVSSYLEHIRSVQIPPVVNQTVVFELEQELTDALITRFTRSWSRGSDSTLLVTVHDYGYRPIRYDVNNFPEQYRMTVLIDYEFRDNVRGRVLHRRTDYAFDHDFYVVAGRGETPEDEPTARKRLVEDLADELYHTLAEEW
jgi:hypothetical protein